jgi:hypothetical protein
MVHNLVASERHPGVLEAAPATSVREEPSSFLGVSLLRLSFLNFFFMARSSPLLAAAVRPRRNAAGLSLRDSYGQQIEHVTVQKLQALVYSEPFSQVGNVVTPPAASLRSGVPRWRMVSVLKLSFLNFFFMAGLRRRSWRPQARPRRNVTGLVLKGFYGQQTEHCTVHQVQARVASELHMGVVAVIPPAASLRSGSPRLRRVSVLRLSFLNFFFMAHSFRSIR